MIYVWVGLALLITLPAAALFGDWLGRRKQARYEMNDRPDDEDRSFTVPNALLALAGLLIGFTFAMAQRHYDSREQIVLAEANAIKTTYERTKLLDDARGEELRVLLRRYVDARLAFDTHPTVFLVLGLVAAVALATVGFASSTKRRRNWLALLVMPLLLAVVIMLVFDIAYPRLGIVHVRDPILNRLRQTF